MIRKFMGLTCIHRGAGAAEKADSHGHLLRAKGVLSTPYILSGTPVIKGTRIPLYDVAALSAAGTPIDDILADYPRLDAEKVELAKIFAVAYPMPGRPRSRTELPKGAVIISDYRVRGRRPGR